VAVLLIFVVLLSIGSGFYASASYFAQQAPTDVTVTTIVYTTTTSWTTSTIWSTVTSVVYGVWTTVQYTTSTSTVTLTGAPITGNYGDTSVEPYPAIITSASAHFLYFTPFTTPSGGLTVQSLSIYIGTSNGNLDMAIYADSSGSPSGATLVNTGLVTMGPSGAWQTISVSAYHLSPSTQYWIAVLFTSGSANLRYNPASGTARWQNIGTSTTMPSPVGPVTSQTCKISMYVTGTIP
jgi:hypothetical protein